MASLIIDCFDLMFVMALLISFCNLFKNSAPPKSLSTNKIGLLTPVIP